MKVRLLFWSGILGVSFFVLTTIIAGFLYSNYSHISQFISESYAVDAPKADLLRFYGYLPSGVLFIIFSLFSIKVFPKSSLKTIGFLGVGFGYGFGTIICSIFNCDAGCNPKLINPSLSQFIHNSMGFVTYMIVPFSILFIAIASRKWKNGLQLSTISYIVFIISFLFVMVLNTNLDSPYKGLIQRIVEGSILFWIIYCSFSYKKILSTNSNS
ncbi:DUF998 domain-containing protein [Flavobacterium sp.]|uniref:DUF998 domain-containing protein n=1 Tax=Flavobacterium sp. TaxID=239 RepID=UPI00374D1FF4